MDELQELTDRIYNRAYEEKVNPAKVFEKRRTPQTEELSIDTYRTIMRRTIAKFPGPSSAVDHCVYDFLTDGILDYIAAPEGFHQYRTFLIMAFRFSWKGKEYSIKPPDMGQYPNREIPTLDFGDIHRLIEKLSLYVKTLERAKPYINAEDKLEALKCLFLNCTPLDLTAIPAYLDRAIAMRADTSFSELERGKDLGPVDKFGLDLFVERSSHSDKYESPHALDFALIPKGQGEPFSEASLLPRVRYALNEKERSGAVFAIQNPNFSIHDDESVESALELLDDSVKLAGRYFRYYQDNQREQFAAVFGEVPAILKTVKDPKEYCIMLGEYLAQSHHPLFSMVPFEWSKQIAAQLKIPPGQVERSILNQLSLHAPYLVEAARYNERRKAIEETLPTRKRLMRKLFKIDSGVLETESHRYLAYHRYQQRSTQEGRAHLDEALMPENISEVYPGAVVSLLATLVMFNNRGIRSIDIPTYMPFRWQGHVIQHEVMDTVPITHAERIQRATTDKFIRTFRRVEYHIDGMELDYTFVDQGLLKAQLKPGHWTANNPILQEIINTVEAQANFTRLT